MKTESNFKTWVLEEARRAGCYAKRIEDMYNVGFPDLIVVVPDYPVFFIEAKRVLANMFGPTPRQFVELQRLSISKHSHPMVMGWHPADDTVYMNPYVEELDRRDAKVQFYRFNGHFIPKLKEYYDSVRQS